MSLEQKVLALFNRFVEIFADVADVIDERRAEFFEPRVHILRFERGNAVSRYEQVFPFHDVGYFLFKRRKVL